MAMPRVVLSVKKILRRQQMLKPRVVTKRVPQHGKDRLQSEGYEDGHTKGT